MSDKTPLFDSYSEFDETSSGLLIKRQQHIPDDFVSELKKQKIDAEHKREGNFMHVASIPVIIHEKWLKEGFDCTKAPYKETLKRLREEHLDAFIVTNKRV